MRYCNNCGKPLKNNELFCDSCGRPVNEGEVVNESSPGKRKRIIVMVTCMVVIVIATVAVIFMLLAGLESGSRNGSKAGMTETDTFAEDIVLQVNNDCIVVNEETDITFTATFNQEPNSPILVNKGKQVCELNDQGINGDITAEDGIYTCVLSINAETVGESIFYAQSGTKSSNQVTLYSFEILDESGIEQIEKEYTAVVGLLEDISKDYLNEDGYIVSEQRIALLDSLEKQLESNANAGNIRFYNRNENSIYIKLTSGIGLLYEPPIFGTASGINLDGPQVMFFEPHSDIDCDLEDMLSGNEAPVIKETAKFSGASTLTGSEVTLESIKNIPSDTVVFWNGHGSYDERLHSCLALGEEVDVLSFALKDLWSQQYKDFICDRIILGAADNKNCWLITSKYIEEYCSDFSNNIFLLASCYSAKDEVLVNSLINKGAATVIGFDDSVATKYALEFCVEVLYSMTDEFNSDASDYCTVSEAFDLAKSIRGDSDIEYEDPEKNFYPIGAHPILTGNSDVRIGGLNEIIIYIKNKNDEIIDDNFNVTLTDENNNFITLIKGLDEEGRICYKGNVHSGDYDISIDGEGYMPFVTLDTINNDMSWAIEMSLESEINNAIPDTAEPHESESIQTPVQNDADNLNGLIADIYMKFVQNKGYEMNGIGFEYEANGYIIMDVNQDGTNELIVNSELKEDPEWGNALVFTYNPTDDSAQFIGYATYYTSLLYSEKYKALVFNETRPSANAGSYEFRCFDKDHWYTDFVIGWELNTDTYLPEYYIFDSGTKSPITDAQAQEYTSEPQLIEFSPMP